MLNLVRKIFYQDRLNVFITIYVNLFKLPLRHGYKFPILIYNRINIFSLKGKIIISCFNKRNFKRIIIGKGSKIRSFRKPTCFKIDGKMILGSGVEIRKGSSISVDFKAQLILSEYSFISDNCKIFAARKVFIGRDTTLGNNVTVLDSNLHFILNINDFSVNRSDSDIHIGPNNWIGPFSMIKKGAKTGKGFILAGPYSFLSKDVSLEGDYLLYGGGPAKLIRKNFLFISNKNKEKEINSYFLNNQTSFNINLENSELKNFINE
jgi:acetyltransferase-like isoleucine patch superfamily enzyme